MLLKYQTYHAGELSVQGSTLKTAHVKLRWLVKGHLYIHEIQSRLFKKSI